MHFVLPLQKVILGHSAKLVDQALTPNILGCPTKLVDQALRLNILAHKTWIDAFAHGYFIYGWTNLPLYVLS